MASKSFLMMLLILSIWAVDNAHCAHHAPAPAVDCSTLIMNMAECLSFVSSGSTVTKPEAACCSGLKTVLKTDADCLCEAFKSSSQLGVSLNMTKALTLPAACKLSTPPAAANCALSQSPAGAPGQSPTPSIAEAPTMLTGAPELAPALAPGSSGSSVLSYSLGTLAVALVLAMFLSL